MAIETIPRVRRTTSATYGLRGARAPWSATAHAPAIAKPRLSGAAAMRATLGLPRDKGDAMLASGPGATAMRNTLGLRDPRAPAPPLSLADKMKRDHG